MRLVKLSDGCYVAVDQIASIKINPYGNSITVRTKDGIGHSHEPGPGQCLCAALDKLVSQVNENRSMTNDQFNTIQPGDMVVHKMTHITYVVTEHHRTRLTAVRTIDISHPEEWEVIPRYEVEPRGDL